MIPGTSQPTVPMASPRPQCLRELTSRQGLDTDSQDTGSAHGDRENISDLITRLQDPYGDMICIHLTDNPTDQPILLQRSLIESVSPWLEKWVKQNMQQFGSRDLHMDTGSEMTRKMFLFCVVKRRIPTMEELEMSDEDEDVREYQKSLVRVWIYAAETGMGELQNAVMEVIWGVVGGNGPWLAFRAMKEGLVGTPQGSAIRRLLVDVLVYMDGGEVSDQNKEDLEIENVVGWKEDWEAGKRKFEERGGVRAQSVGEFLVQT